MNLVAGRKAELPRSQHLAVPVDHELGLSLQDQENLPAQIVAVGHVLLARRHAQEPRANVGTNDQIPDVGARIENSECHAQLPPVNDARTMSRTSVRWSINSVPGVSGIRPDSTASWK